MLGVQLESYERHKVLRYINFVHFGNYLESNFSEDGCKWIFVFKVIF